MYFLVLHYKDKKLKFVNEDGELVLFYSLEFSVTQAFRILGLLPDGMDPDYAYVAIFKLEDNGDESFEYVFRRSGDSDEKMLKKMLNL